jgi:hypothetical protein
MTRQAGAFAFDINDRAMPFDIIRMIKSWKYLQSSMLILFMMNELDEDVSSPFLSRPAKGLANTWQTHVKSL